MKLKTSCFNRTIFKKNITHYWPIWALYFAYLLLAMPYSLWQSISSENYYHYYQEYTAQEKGYLFLQRVLENGLVIPIIFIVAVVAVMFLFSYLYTARNTHMIHALPVTRFELFLTNYVSGILFLVIPQIITFFVTVLVCVAGQITCIQYLFFWLLFVVGISVFAYSLAVFVAMFTGQKGALLAYYLILNFLYVGCVLLISTFQEMVSYGNIDYLTPGKTAVLSPLFYLMRNVGIGCMYGESGLPEGIFLKGGEIVIAYTVVGVVLAVAAYLLYRKRQLETAGDMISIGIIKPIFRWGFAICGGFTVTMILIASSAIDSNSIGSVYAYFIIGIIICGSICFFIAQMLLEKSFKVFRRKRLIECGALCAVCVMALLLFKADVFGIERYQPKAEEIETAFVYMDYPIMLDEEDIPKLLEVQKEVIDSKEEYLAYARNEEGYYYVTFRYWLKDGSRYTRRYPVPLAKEYMSDPDSPVSVLLSFERDNKTYLKRKILGRNFNDSSLYYAGSVDVYNDEGETDTRHLDAKDVGILMEAVAKDIEAGNFDEYYLPVLSWDTASSETYANSIILERYMKNGSFDDEEFYYNYQMYHSNTEIASGEPQIYLRTGEKCVNTIEALEKLGIVNDEWKLLTENEYYTLLEKTD